MSDVKEYKSDKVQVIVNGKVVSTGTATIVYGDAVDKEDSEVEVIPVSVVVVTGDNEKDSDATP